MGSEMFFHTSVTVHVHRSLSLEFALNETEIYLIHCIQQIRHMSCGEFKDLGYYLCLRSCLDIRWSAIHEVGGSNDPFIYNFSVTKFNKTISLFLGPRNCRVQRLAIGN